MLLALALSLLLPSGDPPVKLKISEDVFMRGDRARVYVKTTRPGYLIVLRADAQGRVRVLFPQAPNDDAYIRAGKQVEVRGRGDREAFTVDDAEGSGKILAALSSQPFRTDEFTRAGHWDYWGLSLVDTTAVDAEALLLSIVDGMSVEASTYDYDLVTYTVAGAGESGYRHAPVHLWAGWGGWWGWGAPYGGWGWRVRYAPSRCYGCRW